MAPASPTFAERIPFQLTIRSDQIEGKPLTHSLVVYPSIPLASGGRYDDIGKVFGRARSAIGFSLDLKALLSLVAAPAEVKGIFAAHSDSAEQWQAIQQLRDAGEKVVAGLPGQQPSEACDRQLIEQNGQWQVQPLG